MAKTNPKLSAEIRTITGKKVKQLRKQGILPATVYGQEMEPKSVQIIDKELEAIFNHTGESGLVDLLLEGKTLPILFRNPQYHPLQGNLIHIDCYKVNLKEKISTTVPLVFINESPAVKEGKVLVEVMNEIEIEALPADFPESIEVDLAKLVDIESTITVADLVLDRTKLEVKSDADQLVVKVEEPKAEEVEELPEVGAETVVAPAMNQKTPEQKAADDAAEAAEKKKDKEN